MILQHPLPTVLTDLGPPPPISARAEEALERIWRRDLADPDRLLFNGTLFSVAAIEKGRIAGHFIEYRRYHAQRREPGLFPELRVRPLAVTGLLEIAEGIVFGCRGTAVAQESGAWELAPAGGIDRDAVIDGKIDPATQIVLELHEELGIESRQLTRIDPFCVLEDTESHVIDFGIALAADRKATDLRPSPEYSKVKAVPPAAIPEFAASLGSSLTLISRLLLAKQGLLPSAD